MKKSISLLALVVTIAGSLFFLGSIISPFLYERHATSGIEEDFDLSDYWSFRSFTSQVRGLRVSQIVDVWFYDNWLKQYSIRSELLPIFVSIFLAQILTLIIAVASTYVNKRSLASVPVILCSIVIALMTYVGSTRRYWEISYQLGYWFAYPAMILFFCALISKILLRKEEKA